MKISEYTDNLHSILDNSIFTDGNGLNIERDKAIRLCIEGFLNLRSTAGKVIFIGNGGSASIASHAAIDFLNNCSIPALCFGDSALLTCLSNDFGYERVFEKPIRALITPNDILVAVSSSGKSPNILNAARTARDSGCKVFTFSAFLETNPLRAMGDINLYVPSGSYGYVELAHQIFMHMITDMIMAEKAGR